MRACSDFRCVDSLTGSLGHPVMRGSTFSSSGSLIMYSAIVIFRLFGTATPAGKSHSPALLDSPGRRSDQVYSTSGNFARFGSASPSAYQNFGTTCGTPRSRTKSRWMVVVESDTGAFARVNAPAPG